MASPQERKPATSRGIKGSSVSPGLPPAMAPTKKPGRKGVSPQSLLDVKKKGHRLRRTPEKDLCDQLQGLGLGKEHPVEGTGLVYDERLTQPYCLWDSMFPECPARLAAVKEKLTEYSLMERCVPVLAREATDKEILLVHSPQYLNLMKSTQNMNEGELHLLSDCYDSVYLHPSSFSASRLASGAVLQLVDKVMSGEIRNGMAVVRPPGHHAHVDQMNGYCMFNQLAIAARYAQRIHGVKRVLIVDWDVHHGQGTQFIFENDPSVLYFSLHRYENGRFWPHLAESSSSAVGKEQGAGYNINVPWNTIGMTDADYIAAFLHLLLPVSYEFHPQLVLVAAGFDSVVGDPKGEMCASPACFSHLSHLLMTLAEGRLILSLEGGYNHRSLSEGVCASLKRLLGDPCPNLTLPCSPCQCALDSVSDTIRAHSKYWKILQDRGESPLLIQDQERGDHTTEQSCGEPPTDPKTGYTSMGPDSTEQPSTEPEIDEEPRTNMESEEDHSMDGLSSLLDTVMQDVMRRVPQQRTGLVYDRSMMEHYNMWDSHHPELPQRISRIYQRHEELGILKRCTHLPSRSATPGELQLCHSPSYIKKMEATTRMKPRELHRLGSEYNSIYINNKSYSSACLAAGSVLSAVEAVMKGQVHNAVCIVRPPGHHAEQHVACGFCFFNTVSVAARYAQSLQSPSDAPLRVMILDWDVHHGNGTQHFFQDDASVLYVSLHRYDDGLFFPSSEDAAHDQVGFGNGEGFNVNIPWNNGKMGDTEYLAAFHRVVMPIAYEFNPQLVLISAGFDAARGDPLGGYQVTPEGYAHMTHLLMGLAGGRVVLVLEGGYNLTSISESMAMCTRTLLGDPPPFLENRRSLRSSALRSIQRVMSTHRKYWHSLRVEVTGPALQSEKTKAHASQLKRGSPSRSGPSPEHCVQLLHQGDNVLTAKVSDPGLASQNTSLCHLEGEELGKRNQGKEDNSVSCVEKDENTSEHPLPEALVRVGGSPEQTLDKRHMEDGDALESPTHPRQLQKVQFKECKISESPLYECIVNKSVIPEHSQQVDQTSESLQQQWYLKEKTLVGSQQEELSVEQRTPEHSSLEALREGSPYEGKNVIPCSPFHKVLETPPHATQEVQSPTDQLLKFSDLHLRDDDWNSTAQEEITLPVGGARRKTFCSAGGDEKRSFHQMSNNTEMVEAGFAVTPLSWCPHLESVQVAPPCGLDVTQPCAECSSQQENWVCLTCYQVLCGRYVSQHMLSHCLTSGHHLVLSFSDLSVWCYGCEAYVHHEVLRPVKCLAHRAKFGEEMPTGRDLQSLDTLLDQELLSEAAGGRETAKSQTLCQLLLDPHQDNPEAGFAVTPLSWCPHLESVQVAPPCGLDVTQPCAECSSQQENWVCLTCYQVLCGRYVCEHMLSHGVASGHHLVLSFSDLSVWCYGCEAYVHHEVLVPVKSLAYRAKFGEEMPAI
ncbi:protein deacetylase HDAC6 isoform 2-T3 [Discoglossus pictus]